MSRDDDEKKALRMLKIVSILAVVLLFIGLILYVLNPNPELTMQFNVLTEAFSAY